MPSCSRAMADLEECFSNGHLWHLLRWKSRRGSWRARSKELKVYAPIRYLRKESLPPPSQVKFLFCLSRLGKRLEVLGNCCCCQAVGEGRRLRHQSKSAEEEKHTAQGFD